MIFSFEQSTSIAEAECEELVNNWAGFQWFLFIFEIIMIGKERIVSFLEHDEILQETLFQELVVIIERFEHLHALIRHHTLILSHLLIDLNQSLGKAQIVISEGTELLAYLSQGLLIDIGFIVLETDKIGQHLQGFSPLGLGLCELEVGGASFVDVSDLLSDLLLGFGERKSVEMLQDYILIVFVDFYFGPDVQ